MAPFIGTRSSVLYGSFSWPVEVELEPLWRAAGIDADVRYSISLPPPSSRPDHRAKNLKKQVIVAPRRRKWVWVGGEVAEGSRLEDE
jgi:hypothetical protein